MAKCEYFCCSEALTTFSNHWFGHLRFSQGRTKAMTSTYDRYLKLCTRRNSKEISSYLRAPLTAATGRLAWTSAVRKRLHKGVFSRSEISVPLTSRRQRECLIWAHQHVHWAADQWRHIFFTDESRFSLQWSCLIWR